ncbi:hypothetical protein PVAP13_4NG162400 [Panicum virgatum]|uniref:Uncharacterized protein n=1 Tax=Panicum virgatum TaxID=38727 RepID=A0A8T0TAM1_PANVG|nr:hypothetical protein PVAP13_4NG162400 [Panicum virgatum]
MGSASAPCLPSCKADRSDLHGDVMGWDGMLMPSFSAADPSRVPSPSHFFLSFFPASHKQWVGLPCMPLLHFIYKFQGLIKYRQGQLKNYFMHLACYYSC